MAFILTILIGRIGHISELRLGFQWLYVDVQASDQGWACLGDPQASNHFEGGCLAGAVRSLKANDFS